MINKKTHIDVKVSIESIRDSLRKKIVSEHSHLIADVIMGNLVKTEIGLEMLFKALNGVITTPKYKIGDWILADYNSLYTWQFDKNKSEELLIQGKMRAQIREIDIFMPNPYKIGYKAFKSEELKELESDVQERYICLEDEWPLDPDPDALPF